MLGLLKRLSASGFAFLNELPPLLLRNDLSPLLEEPEPEGFELVVLFLIAGIQYHYWDLFPLNKLLVTESDFAVNF